MMTDENPIANLPSCNPSCYACHYKGFSYSEQLKKKVAWAEAQLGRWKDGLRPILPAPDEERVAYRSKSWMKSSVAGSTLSFGMFRSIKVKGRWEKEFISWNTCPIHFESIQKIVKNLTEWLPSVVPEFVKHDLVGIWMGEPHLVIVSRNAQFQKIQELDWSEVLARPFDRVWFHHNPQVGKKIFGHLPIEQIWGHSELQGVVHPIRAFRQVSQTLLRQAKRDAVTALLQSEIGMVLDLYCGVGDLSLLLPSQVGWVGVELSKEAVIYANTLRSSGTAIHQGFVGAVEARLRDPAVLEKVSSPYALYLNPPRSGLTEAAMGTLLNLLREKPPSAIVYLSCSASSLARDLYVFEEEGFKVQSLQPYDFFPQTEHFETLAVLRKGFSVGTGSI